MNDAFGDLAFAPLIPPALLVLLALGFAAALWMLAERRRTALWPRIFAAGIILLLLMRPILREDERAIEPDIALAVLDTSASMDANGGNTHAVAALQQIRAASPDLRWRIVRVAQEPGDHTRLTATITDGISEIDPARFAGAVVISDGITADAPDTLADPRTAPLHLLLAGNPDIADRRIILEHAPAYSIVGESAEITLRIDDGPLESQPVRVQIRSSDGALQSRTLTSGKPETINIPIRRRGILQLAIGAESLPGGEVNTVNNSLIAELNGVTDRLRVLLVSGIPYPGGRVWRDILKSDANIDLVHFTILRLPTSFDITPAEEMSLIPFPVEELFEEHLPDFDLIIFDRFGLSELLSPIYFQHLSDRVQDGAGLLVVTGDEFGVRGGLAGTPLARFLPGEIAGPTVEGAFRPALTEIGRRHPVTATLPASWGSVDWGRWAMQTDLKHRRGQVVLSGANGRPLLILDRLGEGRVGMLASTHLWWWARGVDGFGPRDELMRRTAHWLMREPDLDEDQLELSARGRDISITARGLVPPEAATLRGAAGTREIRLAPAAPGSTSATVSAEDAGLVEVETRGKRRFILAGETAEMSEIRPRAEPLASAARNNGGGVFWLKDGTPAIRRIEPGVRAAGPGWIGLTRNRSGAFIASRDIPLLPPFAALLLITAAMTFAWWRERR